VPSLTGGSPQVRPKHREKVCVAGTLRVGRFTPRSIERVNRMDSVGSQPRRTFPSGSRTKRSVVSGR
jgi:hypothetical protein